MRRDGFGVVATSAAGGGPSFRQRRELPASSAGFPIMRLARMVPRRATGRRSRAICALAETVLRACPHWQAVVLAVVVATACLHRWSIAMQQGATFSALPLPVYRALQRATGVNARCVREMHGVRARHWRRWFHPLSCTRQAVCGVSQPQLRDVGSSDLLEQDPARLRHPEARPGFQTRYAREADKRQRRRLPLHPSREAVAQSLLLGQLHDGAHHAPEAVRPVPEASRFLLRERRI